MQVQVPMHPMGAVKMIPRELKVSLYYFFLNPQMIKPIEVHSLLKYLLWIFRWSWWTRLCYWNQV